jgi:hypothetical protein
MGLYVQSLESLPSNVERDYYVYLLDYGWTEPLGEALMKNYDQMAKRAEKSNAVVIRSHHRVHFEDQVLSWHNVNGENAKEILPAILLTNRNPHRFKDNRDALTAPEKVEDDLKLVLIPLQKFCSNPTEVAALIDRLFADIEAGKNLADFQVERYVKKGGKVLADAMVLGPAGAKEPLTLTEVIRFLQTFKPNSSGNITRTVQRIHFEVFGGQNFERLVFGYVGRLGGWDKLEWLGETGSDGGRDIWGEKQGKTYCYQCVNYKQILFKKITDDIDKLVKNKTIPDHFTVVCGSAVSVEMREKINAYATATGISSTVVWSGTELEEKIRINAPSLLRRFVEGEPFPDDPQMLMELGKTQKGLTDEDARVQYSEL